MSVATHCIPWNADCSICNPQEHDVWPYGRNDGEDGDGPAPAPAPDAPAAREDDVELAARAICKAWGYEWDVPDDHYCDDICDYLCSEDADDKPTKRMCREAARAVIAALARVPVEGER